MTKPQQKYLHHVKKIAILRARNFKCLQRKSNRNESIYMSSLEVDPKNRMNDLDSRRWLQFQKSWFFLSVETPAEFVAFFTKKVLPNGAATPQPSRVGIFPENAAALQPILQTLERETVLLHDQLLTASNDAARQPELDYVMVDLRQIFTNEESYNRQVSPWLQRLQATAALMKPNSYLTIFIRNVDDPPCRLPLAWEFGKSVGAFLAMKDEKIGCLIGDSELSKSDPTGNEAKSGNEAIYCLNFRRDVSIVPAAAAIQMKEIQPPRATENTSLPPDPHAWFIVKPPPREKKVLLHPAKFPETLIAQFIERFTQPGERVFDPMVGTGSALVAAAACGREAYGVELNATFHDIIKQRFASRPTASKWQVRCGDAGLPETYNELPASFHYIITSPPYWDMLRMKGAETQQYRKQAGLPQFYSDDARDVGNIADYENFLDRLVKIYCFVGARLEPGRFMTIIVKNVKKKGQIYPLAWDLSLRLRENFILGREQFWCQNDQSLAPFGYRYAWVSNTFHHYCLHFRKP